ncbi:MAG: hypothetical protein WCI75_12720, partial [candidate division NC10 bacterium]
SQGGWAAVAALRRGREAYCGDERILGSPDFVEVMRQAVQRAEPGRARRMSLPALVARICRATGISPAALQQGIRRASVARAREGIAYLAIEGYGYPGVALREWLCVGRPPSSRPSSAAVPRRPNGTRSWCGRRNIKGNERSNVPYRNNERSNVPYTVPYTGRLGIAV